MTPARPRADSAAALAMICAASVTAQFVAGKAARDALYLANLPVTSLPAMVVATSVCSILFAIASAKFLRRLSPAAFVPAAFAVCAVLFLIEWLLAPAAPTLIARVVYLQVSGAGPILGSGFWLIASERFNPRSAKQSFGGITAAGTLGGLAGGLLAERVAAVWRPDGRAADARGDQCGQRVAGTTPGRADGRRGRHQARGGRTRIVAGRSRSRSARVGQPGVPARPRGGRGAWHDGRGARRLRLPRGGGEHARQRRYRCFVSSPSTMPASAWSPSSSRPP